MDRAAYLQQRRMAVPLPRPDANLGALGAIAGVADSLQILGYFFDTEPVYFSGAGIFVKLLALALLPSATRGFNGRGLMFVAVLAGLSTLSILAAPYEWLPALMNVVPVSVSLALTLLVTSNRVSLEFYAKSVVNFTFVMSAIYLVWFYRGLIDDHFGRYLYFNGSHPNLGSEIAAAAIILCCIFYRGPALLVRLPVLLIPVFLMQGRAALVASVFAIALRGAYEFRRYFSRYPATTFLLAITIVPAALVFLWNDLTVAFNAALLLDDPNRGTGTNLVGRTDHWAVAYEMFLERPILGYGTGVYDEGGVGSPHNFFLYGLVNLGLTFFVVLAMMIAAYMEAFKRFRDGAIIWLGFLALMVLNDRFLNFAPYPFQMYVMLLSFAGLPPRSSPRPVEPSAA